MKYIAATLFLVFLLFDVESQVVFNFNTYNPNNSQVEEIFYSNVLSPDTTYCIEVVGTYSIWSPSFYSGQCGVIETAPIFPSPVGFSTGPVSTDMEYFFSYPTTSICNSNTPPNQTNRIEISLDNGANWFHPTTSDPYNAAHTYNYMVVGQGFPLGVRHISGQNADDYGQLQFTMTPCSILLPAELVNFSTNCSNGIAELTWTTLTEMDNDYFSIERSRDGKYFEKVAEVDGTGTTTSSQTYHWLENESPFDGTVYRLSQTDFNGTIKYLGVRSLNCENDLEISIYPNPINGTFTISSKFAGNFKLVDLTGKVVLNQTLNSGETMVPSHDIAAGHYLLYIELKNEQLEVRKVTKI